MWFFDKAFLDVFIGSDIDYFVCFMPYKHFQHIEPSVSLSKICVYRCNAMTYELIEYKPSHMMSSEEGFLEIASVFCKNRFMLHADTFQDESYLHFFCPLCGISNSTNTFYCTEVLQNETY